MPKSVAVLDEATAVPTGSFSLPPVPPIIVYLSHAKLTVKGTPVIHEATCAFIETSSGTPSPVTVKAGNTKLRVGGTGVLLHGDSKAEASGTVTIVSASHLRSD